MLFIVNIGMLFDYYFVLCVVCVIEVCLLFGLWYCLLGVGGLLGLRGLVFGIVCGLFKCGLLLDCYCF